LVENCDFSPVMGSPLEYYHNAWYEKTRTVALRDSEKSLRMCLFISTESTDMMEGQTDGQTDTAQWYRLHLCIASHGKNQIC